MDQRTLECALQRRLVRRSGDDPDALARKVGKLPHSRAHAGEHAGAVDEHIAGKVDPFHALERGGGRAAEHVDLVFLHQLEAVLARRLDPFDLEVGDLELRFDARRDALAQLHGIAGGLSIGALERERQGVAAVAHGHGFAVADPVERAVLRVRQRGQPIFFDCFLSGYIDLLFGNYHANTITC